MTVYQNTESRYGQMTRLLLGILLAIQSAHMVEHVAQVIQKFVLRLPKAQGLLGSIFDLEHVHFIYNTGLWIPLVIAFVWYRRSGAAMPFALKAIVWFQGYHVIEHIVKMYQYYVLGITVGPKGILGYVFPLIWLHFWLNLIVLLLLATAFIGVLGGTRRMSLATS